MNTKLDVYLYGQVLAAELCRKHSIPYVTIDSPHDSPLHRHAAVNVVSKECTSEHYVGMVPEDVMARIGVRESCDKTT